MTVSEFKASLTEEQKNNIKSILTKKEKVTDEEFKTLRDYINTSAQALGEDQIAEPTRYLSAALGGLRGKDLLAVIGDGFNPDVFEEWNNLLEIPFFAYRELPNCRLYDIATNMRELFRHELGDNNLRACASDLGYYMLEHLEAGDLVRDVQITHMLLDGGEAAAVAEYVSQAQGEPLRLALNTLSQALRDAPDYVKDTIYDMVRCEGEKIDLPKLLLLFVADCHNMIGQVEVQKIVCEKFAALVEEQIKMGRNEITVFLGLFRLRLAQNARLRREEQEAQQTFLAAMNYLMPPLQQADPLTISRAQIDQYWTALKICQEMAQPKAIAIIFESIIKVEQAQTQDTNRSEEERGAIAENIISQHVDMAKLYYAFPKELQEQFTNYSEPAIALIKAFLKSDEENNKKEENTSENEEDMALIAKLGSYYQVLGELSDHLERHDEAYDALVEAQIQQMRIVGMLQKKEGDKMSPNALLQRLGLSVTNHMLAGHYRQRKSQHDLSVVLTANLNLALECLRAYPHDGRVIHFAINAALELGDLQHRTGGLLAECGTYEKIIRHFTVLNNIRIDGQLCQDIANIHTKCGQVQVDDKIRRFGDGVRNLDIAKRLWTTLAQNTKNPEFQKNADFVAKLIEKYKK